MTGARRSVPEWVVVAAVLLATGLTLAAGSRIAPFNRMAARTTALPIESLPRRPVMQLEFARDAADVEAILEVGLDTQERNVRDVREGNTLDSWRLVPSYAFLLIALTLLIAHGSQRRGTLVFVVGTVMALVIAGADLRENSAIAQILSAPANPANANEAAARAAQAAFVKWILLGLLFIALGVTVYLQQTWRRWLAPLLLLFGVWTLATVGRHVVDRWFG